MESDNLYHLIVQYESFIARGNRILQEYYNISIPPILAKNRGTIPKTGTIEIEHEKLSFNFHGIGCLFEFGNIKVDFDYIFGDFTYKGFDPFKLHTFILSVTALENPLRQIERFNAALGALCYRGLIKTKDSDAADTYTFIKVGST